MMTLIRIISDKLIYAYFKYAVTGLLVIPSNLLINCDTNEIKFSHFLSGLLLNMPAIRSKEQTVNYVDGIDSKYLLDDSKPYPPEAKLGIHT